MMNIPPWYPNDENARAVTEFVLWFSRLEYALKCDPAFANGNKANLDKLKTAIQGKAVPTVLDEALSYLKEDAPRNQTSATGWIQISIDKDDWGFLIESLKTVRNNLFHGGKQQSGPLMEPVRDARLIGFCNLIMKELIAILPDGVRNTFDNA